jgi:Concanavalin A-like lectin/glucanases superfamily
MLDLLDNSCPIDAGNPVNWTHPTMQPGVRPVAWYLALPGLMGGAKWHDLMSNPDVRIGNHGTLTNGPTWRPGTRQGTLGGELGFDGVDDYVTLGPNAFNQPAITFSVWVWWSSASNWQRIIDAHDSAAPSSGAGKYWFLTPRTDGSAGSIFRFAITQSGYSNEQVLNDTSALPTGTWTHVAVTLNGTTGVLYRNGASVASGSVTLAPSAIAPTFAWLGRSDFAGDPYFSGKMDSIRLYSRALPAPEVAALYDLERRGLPGVLNRVPRVAYSVPAATGGGRILRSGILQSRIISGGLAA